ncbi:hypothetical protein B0H14DRAFT_2951996, partial [Mycena olivaceomarginata]
MGLTPKLRLPVLGEHIPYMHERLRDPLIISYSTAMKVGQALTGFGLVLVLRSNKDGVKAGDYLYGFTTWEAYTVQPYVDARVELRREDPQYTIDMDSLYLQRVPDPEGAFPWTKYVGCLGTPGLTAFIGLERVAEAMPTIYISSGASGVGRLTVIASAGTAAKANYLLSLDADVAFNYKTIPVAAALQEHVRIDLFWDNVGGAQLEAALENMNMKGRVICCGAIAEYNIPANERCDVQNMSTIFHRRIRLEGFVVADTPEYNARFFSEIPPLMAEGKIKAQEQLFAGLESGPEAFLS